MSNIFISYSRQNTALAEWIEEKLDSAGHSVFRDNRIDPGDLWMKRIEQEIKKADLCLILLTQASLSSKHVAEEVKYAMETMQSDDLYEDKYATSSKIQLALTDINVNDIPPHSRYADLLDRQVITWETPVTEDQLAGLFGILESPEVKILEFQPAEMLYDLSRGTGAERSLILEQELERSHLNVKALSYLQAVRVVTVKAALKSLYSWYEDCIRPTDIQPEITSDSQLRNAFRCITSLPIETNLVDTSVEIKNSAFVSEMTNCLYIWLCGKTDKSDTIDKKANTVSAHWFRHFSLYVAEEYLKSKDVLIRLEKRDSIPVKQRINYADFSTRKIQKELASSMFGEAYSIDQIFIWPKALRCKSDDEWKENISDKEDENKQRDKEKDEAKGADDSARRHDKRDLIQLMPLTVVDAADDLSEWASNASRKDSVRILSGGPGLGKSSFAKMFLGHRIDPNMWRPVYVPIHKLRLISDEISEQTLVKAIEDVLTSDSLTDAGELFLDRDGPKRTILVLDGLDEINLHGHEFSRYVTQITKAAIELLETVNQDILRLRLVLSARPAAIRELPSDFEHPSCLLELLGYTDREKYAKELMASLDTPVLTSILPSELKGQLDRQAWIDWIDDKDEDDRKGATRIDNGPQAKEKKWIKDDQRTTWWAKRSSLLDDPSDFPPQLQRKDIKELTAVPLLMYLMAKDDVLSDLSDTTEDHKHPRETQTSGKDFKRTMLYQIILKGIYNRQWRGDLGKKRSVPKLSYSDFKNLLEIIGFAAWKYDGRTARLQDIRHLIQQESLNKAFETLQENQGIDFKRIIMAFYFREVQDLSLGDGSFEFIHKSFAEFLAARRISKTLEKLSTDDALSNKELWNAFADLAGGRIEDNFSVFLAECLAGMSENAHSIQTLAEKGLNEIVENGPNLSGATFCTGEEARDAIRMNEELILCVLSACAKVTRKRIVVAQIPSHRIGEIMNDLSGTCVDVGPMHKKGYFSFWDLSKQELIGTQWLHEDLHNASFVNARLYGAMFFRSILKDVDFTSANLNASSFTYGTLSKIEFQDTKLHGASFYGSTLSSADFTAAVLIDASFYRCIIHDVEFTKVILTATKLKDLTLWGNNFFKAELSGTDFRGSDLTGSNFSQSIADKDSVDFSGAEAPHVAFDGVSFPSALFWKAELAGATFVSANLQRSDFCNASLSNSVFRDADLRCCQFFGANLFGADFTGATLSNTCFENSLVEGVTWPDGTGNVPPEISEQSPIKKVEHTETKDMKKFSMANSF